MAKVLFVCLGNICRSPMAEGLFQQVAQAHPEIALQIDSAATSHWEVGRVPHPGTQKILKGCGISTHHMVARQIQPKDFQEFDWIIGMDHHNIADLEQMAPHEPSARICAYMSVVPGKEELSIPDPYYTGDFEETYALLKEGIPYWLAIFEKNKKISD